MDSPAVRIISRLTNTRSGEHSIVLLMFAYSFLAMTSHNILKPITKSKVIDQFGSNTLPLVLMASSIGIGFAMHAYGGTIRHLPRRYVIPLTQVGLVAMLVTFWVLLRSEAAWVTVALYFFSQILGILLISQFWTLANEVYDARQAKRLFGLIGGGASLGSALGASITAITIERVGSNNLLLVSAMALMLCAGIVVQIIRRGNLTPHLDAESERGVGGREAIRLLTESRHLRVLAAIVAFATVGAALVDQQLSMAAEAYRTDEEAIAALLAQVTVYLSLAGFVVQVALTSRIHRSFGIAVALLVLPVSLGVSAVFILLTGQLVAVGSARVIESTFRYSLDKTTREVLFLPIPTGLRYRAKPFIDVTMDRFGKALAAAFAMVLIRPWGLGLDWRQMSYASLLMTGAWMAMALVAWREYLQAFRASIVSREIAPAAIRTDVADADTIEALVEELSSPDERAVLYAIDLLDALDRRNLVTPLLLQHESPRVRARALRAIADTGAPVAASWVDTIERLVQDEDVDVRAAALHALARLAHEDSRVLMRRHLEDAEPRVVVTAAIALANSGDPDDETAAERALLRIVTDPSEAGTAGRREAATALGRIAPHRFRPLLVPLLNDAAPSVTRRAIKSARALGASDGLFVPALLSLLGDRAHKAEAREALVGYGDAIVPLLAHALADRREHLWIRRHIPVTLSLIGTRGAMDALVAALDDADGFLRYKAIVAIEKLRRDDPTLGWPRHTLETAVVRETSRYYNGLTLQHNLVRHALEASHSLLGRALEDKLHRSMDRVYRLLGLLYHVDDVAAARYTIEQGERRRRAAAVEYLDNLLGGVVRKRVMPILDDTPLAEKVRYANGVLRSRPRDLEDTLAQLIHDDDPVMAASAIHFVSQYGARALADDLTYVLNHRPSSDAFVREAASKALAMRDAATSHEGLAIVELVERIRTTPLFESLSVDELFRVAELGLEVRHQAGHEIFHAARAVDDVYFLLQGAIEVSRDGALGREIAAPAVLNVEEALQGVPLAAGVKTIEPCIGFRVPASVFLTMVSDNMLMAQSLFRLLLGGRPRPPDIPMSAVHPTPLTGSARLFRQDPILAGASAAHLLALRAAAVEMPITAGGLLFDVGGPPSIYQVEQGEIRLEHPEGSPVMVATGAIFGVADTLAGVSPEVRAVGTRDGRVLRLDRDDLFAVLADHVDLMQRLFAGAIALRDREASARADRPFLA